MNDILKLEKDYLAWIAELKKRYRETQVKAAVAVNSALIEYYWGLGRDISNNYSGFTNSEIYGKQFFQRLSADLKQAMPGVAGHSTQNLRYCLNFYELYASEKIFQQLVGKCGGEISQQIVGKSSENANAVELNGCDCVCADKILPQVVGKLVLVPWGHHVVIIDKTLFRVRRTIVQMMDKKKCFTPSLRSSASFAFSASAPAGKKRNPVNPVNPVKITWTERDAA